jgi:two-component system response regulator PilR (NtrC family)
MPGNVRELENLLYRAVALGDGQNLQLDAPTHVAPARSNQGKDPLSPDTPSPVVDLPADLQTYLDNLERNILTQALQATSFNRTAAATRLGLSLRQMRYRITRLQIEAPHATDCNDESDG